MHNGKYDNHYSLVTCPFFRGHTQTEIGCEGIGLDSAIKLIFPSKSARDRHEEIFCIARHQNCELYRAILEKYEE